MKSGFAGIAFFGGILLATWHSLWADIIRVPEQQPSLYAAIAAAKNDDSIILAPGTYLAKDMVHVDKKLTIASEYLHGGDYDMVDQTIIKGAPEAVSQWFNIAKEAEGTRLIGLTFEGNSLHSLALRPAYSEVRHCRFIGGCDQLSFEGGGGLVSHCYFEGAIDDAIDADFSLSWVIEYCTISKTKDDGIEIRLHPKTKPDSSHVVRYNIFKDCRRTGVQLIDYEGDSRRKFEIYGNFFRHCGSTAVDCTLNTSNQNVDGSPMLEEALVFNNTFIDCRNALTMAPNLSFFNNIIVGMREIGIVKGKHLSEQASPAIDYNMFFDNVKDWDEGLPVGKNMFKADPRLQDHESAALAADSPAINAAAASFTLFSGTDFPLPKELCSGKTANLGCPPKVGLGRTR